MQSGYARTVRDKPAGEGPARARRRERPGADMPRYNGLVCNGEWSRIGCGSSATSARADVRVQVFALETRYVEPGELKRRRDDLALTIAGFYNEAVGAGRRCQITIARRWALRVAAEALPGGGLKHRASSQRNAPRNCIFTGPIFTGRARLD